MCRCFLNLWASIKTLFCCWFADLNQHRRFLVFQSSKQVLLDLQTFRRKSTLSILRMRKYLVTAFSYMSDFNKTLPMKTPWGSIFSFLSIFLSDAPSPLRSQYLPLCRLMIFLSKVLLQIIPPLAIWLQLVHGLFPSIPHPPMISLTPMAFHYCHSQEPAIFFFPMFY